MFEDRSSKKLGCGATTFKFIFKGYIEYCVKNDRMPSDIPWKEAAEFTLLNNNWFDVLNYPLKFVENAVSKMSLVQVCKSSKTYYKSLRH